eukprot:943499-Pleurochrysis_carterae.AAC.2
MSIEDSWQHAMEEHMLSEEQLSASCVKRNSAIQFPVFRDAKCGEQPVPRVAAAPAPMPRCPCWSGGLA